MAFIREPIPVKLICGVTFNPNVELNEILHELETLFSPIALQSDVFNFSSFTSYYEAEMGSDLKKVFLAFQDLIDPATLASSKIQTTAIETNYSIEGARQVNLDTGYITAAKLVLATAKDFAHRIYIGQGIYGDVQFRFRQGRFEPSKWTYPDYQTDMATSFFNQVRNIFMQQDKTDD